MVGLGGEVGVVGGDGLRGGFILLRWGGNSEGWSSRGGYGVVMFIA